MAHGSRAEKIVYTGFRGRGASLSLGLDLWRSALTGVLSLGIGLSSCQCRQQDRSPAFRSRSRSLVTFTVCSCAPAENKCPAHGLARRHGECDGLLRVGCGRRLRRRRLRRPSVASPASVPARNPLGRSRVCCAVRRPSSACVCATPHRAFEAPPTRRRRRRQRRTGVHRCVVSRR